MERMTVAVVQYAWAGSREAMIEVVRGLVAEAAGRGAALVCVPELSLSPYFPITTDPAGLVWAEPALGGDSDRVFGALARTHGVSIISSIVERTLDEYSGVERIYDTAVLHRPDGVIGGVTRKVHIPSGEGYHEDHFFQGGDSYPVHRIGDLSVAAPTCYDQWFPELARIYAMNGAEFVFYPTAIGSEPSAPDIDTQDAWQIMMRAHAIANGLYVAAANRVGVEQGQSFYGGSFICNPMGQMMAEAGRDSTEVITAELDPELFARWRGLFPLLHQRMPARYARLLETT
ncbi:MAG: nitrilase-related carbon-nitrogen hydrolase [Chloroflexota bacterium]|nr:nitrilase-related carbon-nitrogen hydrolase [Chloroflexota bacterium]